MATLIRAGTKVFNADRMNYASYEDGVLLVHFPRTRDIVLTGTPARDAWMMMCGMADSEANWVDSPDDRYGVPGGDGFGDIDDVS